MVSKNKTDSYFEKIVLPELEILYRTAWSLTRSEIDAQDLVQETLLKAYAAIERFDGRYPRAWLLTILRNTNINTGRKKKPELFKNADQANLYTEDSSKSYDPEEILVEPIFEASVQDAYNSLRDDSRHVIDLVDLQGFSYQEAAEKMSVPVGTVMSRLHRARKHIRKALSENGIDGEVK